jgi:hypothetical protein
MPWIAALDIEGADHDQHDACVVALGRLDPPPPAGSAGPALSAPGSKKVARPQEQHTTLARWQTAKYRAPSGPPTLRIKTYIAPRSPLTEAVANHLVRPSMGKVSRKNTVVRFL